jgi:gluconokinase
VTAGADHGAVLALDLGTSSVRALVLDHDGELDPSLTARRPVDLLVGAGGRAELDPEAYLASVVACLDELHEGHGLQDVSDVVLASQWHSVVAVDEHGRTSGGVLTWADTRGRLAHRSDVGLAGLHARTGAWPHVQYWTAKVPWLLEHCPSSAARLLGLPELIGLRLLGDMSTSASMASGTGLLDWARGDWDPEALDLAGVTAGKLPVIQPEDWSGRLLPEWQRRWPALARARWHPVVGDGAAASIGAGCVDASAVNVTVGTSAAVRLVDDLSGAGPLPPALWRYRVDGRRVVSGVALSSGGGVFDWTRSLIGLQRQPADAPGLYRVQAGSDGLTALPFQAGARAPRDVAAGRGVFAGMSLATSPLHLISAVMEAVCFELAEAVETIEAATGRRANIVGCGGALEASEVWRSRLASTLGRPIHVIRVPEASARGAALLHCLGLSAAAQPVDVVPPQSEDVEHLSAARARYEALRAAHEIPPLAQPAAPREKMQSWS